MISIGSLRRITTARARGVGHISGATSVVLLSTLVSSQHIGGEVGAAPTYQLYHCPIISNKAFLDSVPSTPLLTEGAGLPAVGENKLPLKLKDPGSFIMPFNIGESYYAKALCDLGPSINLTPTSVSRRLGICKARPTIITLQLTDLSLAYPEGKIEDVLVRVDTFIFPIDFIIFDFEADKEVPIILERPFLEASRTRIDVQKGELIMQVQDEQVTFNVLKALRYPDEVKDCFTISEEDPLVSAKLEYNDQLEDISSVSSH
ncbi:uncharacterized protein LOC105779019 [Gossypium raimondii]|uniref:uncharacterized protein LOC105779019 n=1 Tax=Gossypium raimondii TaxID=29730 RepID=UPI00063A9275|nr:uncharacterized protein LOC105779019 [Gossypium raimondii]